MPDLSNLRPHRKWSDKFADAGRGVLVALAGNNSFWVHAAATLAVIAAAWLLRLDPIRWCLLCICITVVLSAELLNTALEEMAKAIDQEYNTHLRDALDIGSAAVLVAAAGGVAVGLILLLPPLLSSL